MNRVFNLRDVVGEKDHEVMIRLHVNSVCIMRLCFLYNKNGFDEAVLCTLQLWWGLLLIYLCVLHDFNYERFFFCFR